MSVCRRAAITANSSLAKVASIPTPFSKSPIPFLPPPKHVKFDYGVQVALTRQRAKSFSPFLSTPTNMSVIAGFQGGQQVRYAHTDVCKYPNFDYYRRDSTRDPTKSQSETEVDRKMVSYLVVGVGLSVFAVGAKQLVRATVNFLNPSKAVLAVSKLEVDLASIPEGKNAVFKWREKPLFIRHRTDAEVDSVASVSLEELRDPETDQDRVKDPKFLVLLGICTHLGCVPISHAGEYGGYYCPCHGSHYDASGRIRKGPAPLNLEVPPYSISDSGVLVVG
ncbi:hypothetical protein BOX15_Mlig034383g1 [Macrostomum lignano]|uniref:Cytochrome b-c1 complex subunit Rieske, mitochondrial n=2 Tax=Macrostomum lignano TaxID=282301 RepID=A0A267DPE4_9PLAT|nr:hypothetical protein BOX15_Mlig034383g2 [Macrostomum lignano]PAA51170.1 hypothetical protein BOX15_Mlig034383g1 [Macrostomum lignano]